MKLDSILSNRYLVKIDSYGGVVLERINITVLMYRELKKKIDKRYKKYQAFKRKWIGKVNFNSDEVQFLILNSVVSGALIVATSYDTLIILKWVSSTVLAGYILYRFSNFDYEKFKQDLKDKKALEKHIRDIKQMWLPLQLEANHFEDLAKDSFVHLLIAGSSGSGKGVLLMNILLSLLKFGRNFKMYIIDFKEMDYQKLTELDKVHDDIIVDHDSTLELMTNIFDEHKRRTRLMTLAGVNHINKYNKIKGVEKLERIVIVVDEFAELIEVFKDDKQKGIKSEIKYLITKISQLSRATGIHLILATQRPTVDIITGAIKTNCRTIGLRVESHVDSGVINISGLHEIKEEFGTAYFKFRGNITRLKVPFKTDRQIDKILSKLS